MDEATWAILLCKENSGDGAVNSVQEYRDDNHNNLESIQQHFTDISNSFMDDGGGGQYNNSNSSNSSLSIRNYNNNNNINSNNNFSNTSSKEYLRLGSNGLPLRNVSPNMDGDEFIDLEKNCHLTMMHYNNHHHHNPNQHQFNNNNNNNNSVIFTTIPPEEQIPHHQYTDADHNHYHLQNHHLMPINYNHVVGPIPHYNTGTDTSSSNASSISAQRNHSHNNNNNQRHQVSSFSLRKVVQSTSAIRERTNEYHPYMTHQSTTPYSNTDQESCSDSESKKQINIKDEPSTCPGRRRPGRPRGSRRKKPEKLGRLWEFIRDLLLNPESCPSLICWDNYEEGMFRFVRSDKVAKLWGEKRDNPEMNYEKLSRAMRYYYKSNVLQPVFGRRLVYKFGPEARGWKTENPNFTC